VILEKRKYVGLPEYVKNRKYDSCSKKETHHEKPTYKQNQSKPTHKRMKQIWVRKDSLSNVPNKKGPNVRWVPKNQK